MSRSIVVGILLTNKKNNIMANSTKLPKIKVSRKYHDLQTPALVSFTEGTKFSGTAAGTPPVADATIHADANTLLLTHNGRQTATSKTATNTETTQRNALLANLDKNANYLENAANDAALAAADAAAGIGLVNAVGFKVAGKGNNKRHTHKQNSQKNRLYPPAHLQLVSAKKYRP